MGQNSSFGFGVVVANRRLYVKNRSNKELSPLLSSLSLSLVFSPRQKDVAVSIMRRKGGTRESLIVGVSIRMLKISSRAVGVGGGVVGEGVVVE